MTVVARRGLRAYRIYTPTPWLRAEGCALRNQIPDALVARRGLRAYRSIPMSSPRRPLDVRSTSSCSEPPCESMLTTTGNLSTWMTHFASGTPNS